MTEITRQQMVEFLDCEIKLEGRRPGHIETQAYTMLKAIRAALTEKVQGVETKHKFAPDNQHPQFCGLCGYAKHETLKHTDANEISPALSAAKDGAG